ncbi:hypothetical protein [Planococcus rifietoensis]|uniref:hypothetical protein n=1 Tax=Planococcus rifietoensis TaxID=200991 RepID=UPI00384EC564
MSKITEVTSIQEMEHFVKETESLLRNKKSLKKLGFTPIEIAKMHSQVKRSKEFLNRMKNTLEKFGEYFSNRGWCAYESFSSTVMENIVNLAEIECIDVAEEEMLAYYRNKLTINTGTLLKNSEFKKRIPIFKVAINHHISKDYISSVPLFLMLMDGFVNDIERTGLFATQTNLTAWDSIAAHENGIGKIVKELNRSRKKTTIDSIDFPYRNGILHGRDLNYANEKVSAKALNLLLALGDWAEAKRKMKMGKSQEQFVPPTYQENLEALSEILIQHQQTQEFREQINKWKKREIKVGIDIPAHGEEELYEKNSPERSMIKFFEYINQRNYGHIARMIHIKPENFSLKVVAGEMRENLKDIKIKEFNLLEVNDIAAAITELKVKITFILKENVEYTSTENFRWIFVDELGEFLPRSMTGKWSVEDSFTNIWSAYELRVNL